MVTKGQIEGREMTEGDGNEGVKHTNTTRSNVSCNHDRALAGLELVQNPVALVLLLVAMNRCVNVSTFVMREDEEDLHSAGHPS